jgi:hypothetical protein
MEEAIAAKRRALADSVLSLREMRTRIGWSRRDRASLVDELAAAYAQAEARVLGRGRESIPPPR